MSKVIGVLGIQGAFLKHQIAISRLGLSSILVRNRIDLKKIDSIIIPGGESTTIITILKKHNMWESLKDFSKSHPVFGTCAGIILMAKKINEFEQFGTDNSLALMDIEVSRNSYGRQIESFSTQLSVSQTVATKDIPAIFIRAPQVMNVGSEKVEVLATFEGTPVLLRQNNYLGCTFHPELTCSLAIHDYFCKF